MAIAIPELGKPIGRYQEKFSFGVASDNPDVDISSATGAQALININDINVKIHSIKAQVETAFDGDTSLAFTIGDTDVDGFWTDTLFVFSSTGAGFNTAATTVAYANGRVYTATDVINLTVTGGMTAGLANLLVEYETGVDTDLAPS